MSKPPKIFLLLISVIITLALLETSLRCGIVKNKLHDELTGNAGRAGPTRTILILGDSFGRKISPCLYAELKPYGVRFINTAFLGFGPLDYLVEMKTRAVSSRPDITILFYFAGNDLTDVQYNLLRRTALKQRAVLFLKSFLNKFYMRRYFKTWQYRFLLRALDYEKFKEMGISPEYITLARNEKINPWLLEASRKNPNFLVDNILMETGDSMAAWEKVKAMVSEMQHTAHKINSEFVVVIFPSTLQVNSSHYDLFRGLRFNADERMLTSDRPQVLLKNFCKENNIPCLDLLPYFRAEKAELYCENDDHLDLRGNRLAAQMTRSFLVQNTCLRHKIPAKVSGSA